MPTNLPKANLPYYANQHGIQLKEFMTEYDKFLYTQGCYWSALKYHIRAGKKEGESLAKDIKKRDDYINDLIALDWLNNKEEIIEELEYTNNKFENYRGK
ncbi:gp025 (endogenous virus) [Lactococcus phage KSY1]|uniref:Gp025 n=1 Tax=Lactococcus phage KSY1 TaxID=2913972 RepID=A6MA89_9CAUD|nr:gp025 [Lactococcus phage KSY1]ABG21567.1 gp025 [Lactococcus phage KSY1]